MTTTAIERSARTEQRNWPLAVVAGLITASLGAALWFAAHEVGGRPMVWLAVPVGAAIGYAVSRGARGRGPAVMALVFALLAMVAAQNLAQRAALQRGIEELQEEWDVLSVAASSAASDAAGAPPGGFGAVPPPEIVPMIPVEGLVQMPPEVMAEVWEHIPDERRAELPPDQVAAVEAVLAADAPPESAQEAPDVVADDPGLSDGDATIPRAVLACAPPPDFTQPDAAAGLGFPDGVPLFLPAADLFGEDRVRGDGEVHDPADPRCFATEHLKDRPDEGTAWLLGAIAAVALASRRAPRAASIDHPEVDA